MSLRKASRLLILGVVTIAIVLAAAATLSPHQATVQSNEPAPRLHGTLLGSVPTPNFTLADQFGREVSLRTVRGKITVIIFVYTHCLDTCPLTMDKLRRVISRLGSAGNRVDVLAVSTDPLHDTPDSARDFLRRHGLLHRWHFLLGSVARLEPIWSAYHIYSGWRSGMSANSTGPPHTAVMYLLDARGRERELLHDDAPAPIISADLRVLLGLVPSVANVVEAPQVGARAPDFELPRVSGSPMRLRDLRGKAIILNFWATWCPPCLGEMPRLQQAYERFAKHGLVVIGIDQQEYAGPVRDFVRSHGITFPVVLDRDANTAYAYQVSYTPTSFFVDRRGIVRYKSIGPVSDLSLRSQLGTILRPGSAYS